MAGRSAKPKKRERTKPRAYVPHPDDVADVRAGLEEALRGEGLSAEESAEYLRALAADPPRD